MTKKIDIKALAKLWGINACSIIVDGNSLMVGGSLDLRGTAITSLPDSLMVGGYLNLEGTAIKQPKAINRPSPDFSFKVKLSVECRFNIRGFTATDGILAKILSAKGSVKKIVIVGKKTTSYLITDDKGNYAHGDTIKQARDDLAFKTSKRDASEWKSLPPTTKKTPPEWAGVYRDCTGACASGIKHFMEGKGKLKAKYTLAEILEQTKGAYGYEQFKGVVCS